MRIFEIWNRFMNCFCCRIIKDYAKKIFTSKINRYGDYNITDYESIENQAFLNLDLERQNIFINNISDITNYNKDFANLTNEYIITPNSKANRNDLISFIRSYDKNYYYNKAIFVLSIKALLIIIEFILSIILTYPKYVCTSNNDENFLICLEEEG